ncbi:RNA-binding protein, putative [Plasmodium knowlesi strain H]|uniref:RNA-binding protein, putative n=3 Tax=Plasmodium knowlesi TaxID=5850 RepID=A0A1A7VZ27_PLAKH|nr:RNA-binding protein, putative [Plasmodium knowlesi strain H]OTN67459.1 putative RNA-binding protein [Plasmodium knowlesi]CAA9987568.1 RNA-binding protein, putative [Plasmodium knowlesi strain H]SBO27039.1 RNA-binding protein, putative [Plasmodium knowlesi strain H]SBO29205.1 RNA-binding protein, putative [Plasmodium knowlesi strain H]VVS77042.1 RNA-binding protein, putative [Plasmodium knowlesi strain H]
MSIKNKIDMSLDELIEKENIKGNQKGPNEKKIVNKSIEKNSGQKFLHSIIISNVNSNNLDLYKKEFSKFGKIYNIYHDSEKKITYVKYDNKNSCENAIKSMNGNPLDGDTLTIVMGKKIPDKKNNRGSNQNNHMNNNNNNHKQNKIIPHFKMPMYNPNGPYPYYMNNNHGNFHPPPYGHIPYQNPYQNNMFDKSMPPFNGGGKNVYDNQKNNTIIVTNVPTYLNAEDIFSAFQETGKIVDVQILMNEKRKLTGIVSIEYEKNESASDAVRMYDGGFLNDNRIRVFLDCR